MIASEPDLKPALAQTSASASAARRPALAFIFITVVLDALAFGVIIPVLPKLVESFLGGDTARAAKAFGVFGTVWALMQLIFSPLLGMLSDRFGRRPVLLLSCFGLGLDYILMALAPSLRWLLVGRVISGICAASFATAGAYIADVIPTEKRAASFGFIGAGWGLGFVMGPAIGGLLGSISLRLPFFVAACLALLSASYGLFVLPESLPKDRRQGFSWKRANPIGALGLLRAHPELFGMLSVSTLYWLAHQVLPSVMVLYASYRYGWTERQVGLMLGMVGVFNVAVQGALVRPVVARFGERRALLTGLGFGAAGFAMYGLAKTGVQFLLGVPVFALMGFFNPATQGIITRRIGPKDQGQLQGLNSSLMGMTGLIGPFLFTQTFARFIGSGNLNLPGAPFLLAALLLLTAMLIALRATRLAHPSPTAAPEQAAAYKKEAGAEPHHLS